MSYKMSSASFLDAVSSDLGPLDLLVTNAGIMPISTFLDEDDATTDTMFAINVF
jgi:NADP-dependent 3-hydroxy acid dehydrogenase YdfG